MVIKNVALVGAAGNVGSAALTALIASKRFNLTVVTRPGSSSTFPDGVTVRTADYDSQSSLVEALTGQDAVIIATGGGTPGPGYQERVAEVQNVVVDAAVQVGVKFIIPNNFGGDLVHEPGRSNKLLAPKREALEYLDSLAAQGKISYAAIETGPFFDWGLMTGFMLFDIKEKKATLINDGTLRVNCTTLDSIATAVVTALSNPDLVRNRPALISDFYVTQQEILAALEAETGSKFEVTRQTEEEHAKEGYTGAFRAGVWGKASCVAWGITEDSKLLGLQAKDIREEVAKVLRSTGVKA